MKSFRQRIQTNFMPNKTTNRIFVYGSLRKEFDHPKHELLNKNGELLGAGSCSGKLYLIDWYPGVLPSDDPTDQVYGEVYEIHQHFEAVIESLDHYEGCAPEFPEPHLYVRRIETITLEHGGSTNAWIYFYNHNPDGERLIPGGDFLKWKKS